MKMKNMKQVKEHVKDMNMKRLFRRNQIIITTLAVMIAAAGYLNYAGKRDLEAGSNIYEAGAMDISDEDILAENKAALQEEGNLIDIPSLDQDVADLDVYDQSGAGMAAGTEGVGTGLAQGGTEAAQSGAVGAGEQQMAQADTTQPETTASQQTGLENPGEAVLTSGMSVADYIANVQLSREQVRAKNKEALMNLINSTNIDEAAKQRAIQDMIKLTEVSEKENAAETLLMAKGFSDPVVSITNEKVDVVINAASITDPQRAQIEDIVKRKTETAADQIIITLLNMAD